MTPFDIHSLLAGLAEKRPIFHSEADFQFALAWEIREQTGRDVRLEYPPCPNERMRVDIWVPDIGTAIELKYPLRERRFEWQGELFVHSDGARDIDCYDFLKDLMRLERITAEVRRACTGIAVLLTNDWQHWKPPKPSDTTIGAEFRVHEGHEPPEKMCWSPKASPGSSATRESPIVLSGSYRCHWRNYGPLLKADRPRGGQFRYLAIEVRR